MQLFKWKFISLRIFNTFFESFFGTLTSKLEGFLLRTIVIKINSIIYCKSITTNLNLIFFFTFKQHTYNSIRVLVSLL